MVSRQLLLGLKVAFWSYPSSPYRVRDYSYSDRDSARHTAVPTATPTPTAIPDPTTISTATAERQFWTVPESAVSNDVYWKDIAFLTCEKSWFPLSSISGDFPLIAKLSSRSMLRSRNAFALSRLLQGSSGSSEADAEWKPTALGEGGGEGRVIFYLKDYGNGKRGHGFRRRCEDGALALPIVLNLCVEEPQQ